MSSKRVVKLPFVIVRCRDAGVHAGLLVSRKGREVVLKDSRRIWYWKGAATLSELAMYGAKYPAECRICVPVFKTELLDACEVLYCQPEGRKMIEECAPWRA